MPLEFFIFFLILFLFFRI
uniref:Uncharacterized protein n=1 Tax=Amphimedon queenslandica TaxID=400682 RepID=A0A1X7TBU2_AMPQE